MTRVSVSLPPPSATGDLVEEIRLLLSGVAVAASAPRADAVRYTTCRSALLLTEVRSVLPGYLSQCTSIDKFHTFINLYHPAKEARIEYIAASLEPAQSAAGRKPQYDVFEDNDV